MRRKSTRSIPAGDYCYRFIGLIEDGSWPHKIKMCPYYTRKYDKRYRGKFSYCKYLNSFGDAAFDDQCKCCGIKTMAKKEIIKSFNVLELSFRSCPADKTAIVKKVKLDLPEN